MQSYSQCGQDLFVLSLLNKNNGSFIDLGCNHPIKINNTYLLELKDWYGLSFDIEDYSGLWQATRKNQFLRRNAFDINFNELLPEHYKENVIDYLTLDMEKLGDRYKLLDKVLSTNYEFKIITIEHDSHLGNDYVYGEKEPQRKLLQKMGYHLLCSDVAHWKEPTIYYEDWWVNQKYFNIPDLAIWQSDKESCDSIFKKVGVEYSINEMSHHW